MSCPIFQFLQTNLDVNFEQKLLILQYPNQYGSYSLSTKDIFETLIKIPKQYIFVAHTPDDL